MIKEALWSIPVNKAPGIDGYKETWDVVRADDVQDIHEFFSTGKLLKVVNTTSITLVPKIGCPSKVG